MINLDLSEKKWTKVHKKYQKWSILESFTVEQCNWAKIGQKIQMRHF